MCSKIHSGQGRGITCHHQVLDIDLPIPLPMHHLLRSADCVKNHEYVHSCGVHCPIEQIFVCLLMFSASSSTFRANVCMIRIMSKARWWQL